MNDPLNRLSWKPWARPDLWHRSQWLRCYSPPWVWESSILEAGSPSCILLESLPLRVESESGSDSHRKLMGGDTNEWVKNTRPLTDRHSLPKRTQTAEKQLVDRRWIQRNSLSSFNQQVTAFSGFRFQSWESGRCFPVGKAICHFLSGFSLDRLSRPWSGFMEPKFPEW